MDKKKVLLLQVMNSNFSKYLLVVLVTALVIGGGTYWLVNNKADSDLAALQSNIDTLDAEVAKLKGPTTTTEPSTAQPTPTAPLKTYKSDEFGIEMQIPSDWEQVNSPHGVQLTGTDKINNLQLVLSISKDTTAFSCSQVFKDSEELAYSNPLPGQRLKTNLSFTSIYYVVGQPKSTICNIMVTGSFSAKQGDSIDRDSATFQSALPTSRINVYVSKADSTTSYHDADFVFSSTKYAELIAALKSAKIK